MESYSMDPVQGKDGSSQDNLDSNVDPKSKQKGPKKIVHRFFHYTTINGLQRLASARTILGRLFWIVVVLGALVMFSKDVYELIQQYHNRPVSVVSKVEYFKGMKFPAITVCNVNAIRKSSYEFSKELKQTLVKRDNNTCFKEAERGKNPACENEKDEVEEFENEINHILSSVDEKELRKSGHQHDSFIVSCRFNGQRCSELISQPSCDFARSQLYFIRKKEFWVQFWDPQYGNCFTFNSRLDKQNRTLFRTNKPGSPYGLKLAFNIELDEYIPQLTTDAGIKVSITEPGEMPFPIYNSISLAPGSQSEIAMKRIQIQRVDRFNNGSCRVNQRLAENNPYRLKYGATYSVQACLQRCYARAQISRCGCAEYSYVGATPAGKTCDENNQIADDCLDSWKDAEGSCEKTCRDSCQETIYESSVTFTQWPHSQSVETVLDSVGFNYSDYNNDVDIVRSNFLSVNIFFQRFRETRIEETLSYETANLLADIGGQIGLWAGLSVISMCELLELFALLVRNFLQRER